MNINYWYFLTLDQTPTKMPPYGDIFACTFNYFYCLLLIFNCSNNLSENLATCQEYLNTKYKGVLESCTTPIFSYGLVDMVFLRRC